MNANQNLPRPYIFAAIERCQISYTCFLTIPYCRSRFSHSTFCWPKSIENTKVHKNSFKKIAPNFLRWCPIKVQACVYFGKQTHWAGIPYVNAGSHFCVLPFTIDLPMLSPVKILLTGDNVFPSLIFLASFEA